jgi:hypothetical protein
MVEHAVLRSPATSNEVAFAAAVRLISNSPGETYGSFVVQLIGRTFTAASGRATLGHLSFIRFSLNREGSPTARRPL